MTVVALASAKGAPGVTTSLLALAAVWPSHRRLLVVEADPDGGDLAARAGLRPEPGLLTLAAAARRTLVEGEVDRHTQSLPGGVPALIAPPEAEHASRAVTLAGPDLAKALPVDGPRDVLIDCGRLRPEAPTLPLLARASKVVVVARPRVDELQHVAARVRALSAVQIDAGLVLVGERPFPPEEVADALQVEVVGMLADDVRTAEALCGAGVRRGKLDRTLLLRTARSLVDRLLVGVASPPVRPPPGPPTGAGDLDSNSTVGMVQPEPAGPRWASLRASQNGGPS